MTRPIYPTDGAFSLSQCLDLPFNKNMQGWPWKIEYWSCISDKDGESPFRISVDMRSVLRFAEQSINRIG